MVDSKDVFRDALLRLSKTKKLSKITVKELVGEADTARQTFYNCFHDINEAIAYTGLSVFLSPNIPFNNPESMRLGYEIARQHKDFFCQLPHLSGQNSFREALFDWLYNAYCDAYATAALNGNERTYRELYLRHAVHGGVELFLDWCASGMEWPIDVINAVLIDRRKYNASTPVTVNPPAPSRRT